MRVGEKSKTNDRPEFPRDLLEAMERGEVFSPEMTRRLFEVGALALGLTFHEAVEAARRHELPHNALGADLSLLAEMLPDS